jgi:hypothetical protein
MAATLYPTAFAAKKTSSSSANSMPTIPKVTQRILHFPEQSFGGLYVIPKGNTGTLYGEPEVAVAKGSVKLSIPAGSEVLLKANPTLLQNPAELDKWSPDIIDCLDIKSAFLNVGDEQFGTKVLSHVKKLTGLRILRAPALEPDDIGVSALKALKKLEVLALNIGMLDGSCLKDLQTMPALGDLDLSDNQININNLSYIEKFPVLKQLGLHRCRLNKAAIQLISKSSTIEGLNLGDNSGVRDDSCDYLCKMPSLSILDLVGTQVTTHGLIKLGSSKSLRKIYLSNAQISSEALSELKKALPRVDIIVKKTAPTKETSRIFAPLPK